MSDLISRSETIKTIWKLWNEEINNSAKFSSAETKTVTRAFQKLQRAIENQSTAYNVDAVVEHLKYKADVSIQHHFSVEHNVAIRTDDAIAIVRKGGV